MVVEPASEPCIVAVANPSPNPPAWQASACQSVDGARDPDIAIKVNEYGLRRWSDRVHPRRPGEFVPKESTEASSSPTYLE